MRVLGQFLSIAFRQAGNPENQCELGFCTCEAEAYAPAGVLHEAEHNVCHHLPVVVDRRPAKTAPQNDTLHELAHTITTVVFDARNSCSTTLVRPSCMWKHKKGRFPTLSLYRESSAFRWHLAWMCGSCQKQELEVSSGKRLMHHDLGPQVACAMPACSSNSRLELLFCMHCEKVCKCELRM